jgi:drug/metabolite transporter (DMT)-like permease
MAKILIILVIAFTFEAIGVITLKTGLDRISARYTARAAATPRWKNTLHLVGDWFTTKAVLLGLLLETIFFILLQYLLAQKEVSFVWPLTAMSFVMTTLAAKFILGEHVDTMRWSGVALILVGAMFISYGEYHKAKPAPAGSSLPAAAK